MLWVVPPTLIPVDDPADPRVASYVALTDAQLRAGIEERSFIVEGHLALGALLASAYPLRSVLVADTQLPRVAPAVAGLPAEVPLYVASRKVLDAVVGFRIHRGVVACAARTEPVDPAALVATGGLLLVLEGVNDHENLGGLFRNAAAFGASGVLLDPTCADPLYRRSVRVSLGHVLRVPFARLDPWPASLHDLRRAGVATLALTPDPSAAAIDDVVARLAASSGRRGIALMLGAEGAGLSEPALASTTERARIPMADGVDSLNVATAAAVALHVVRQGLGR